MYSGRRQPKGNRMREKNWLYEIYMLEEHLLKILYPRANSFETRIVALQRIRGPIRNLTLTLQPVLLVSVWFLKKKLDSSEYVIVIESISATITFIVVVVVVVIRLRAHKSWTQSCLLESQCKWAANERKTKKKIKFKTVYIHLFVYQHKFWRWLLLSLTTMSVSLVFDDISMHFEETEPRPS